MTEYKEIMVKLQVPSKSYDEDLLLITEWMNKCFPDTWGFQIHRQRYTGEPSRYHGMKVTPDTIETIKNGKNCISSRPSWDFYPEKGMIHLHGFERPIRAFIHEMYVLNKMPGGLNYYEDFEFAEKQPVLMRKTEIGHNSERITLVTPPLAVEK